MTDNVLMGIVILLILGAILFVFGLLFLWLFDKLENKWANSKKKHILTHNYPTKDHPYAGIFVKDWIDRNGGTVCYMPFGGNFAYNKNPFKLLFYIMKCWFKIIFMRGEFVCHWWIPLGFIAVLASKKPHVICHGSDLFWLEKHPIVAKLSQWMVLRVKTWRFVSLALCGLFFKIYNPHGTEFTIKPMPINSVFKNRKSKRIPWMIASAGTFMKRKRFDLLIKAVLYVRRNTSIQVTLILIGSGQEEDYLKSLVGHRDGVAFVGKLKQKKIAEIFNKASLFILVSEGEGYGLVLAEAKACGCPTMVTSGDGKTEIADIVIYDKDLSAEELGNQIIDFMKRRV